MINHLFFQLNMESIQIYQIPIFNIHMSNDTIKRIIIIKRSPTAEERYFLFNVNDEYLNKTSIHTKYNECDVSIDDFRNYLNNNNIILG